MTEAQQIAAWLRKRAADRRYWKATFGLRLRTTWLTWRHPHGIASAGLELAADAIERVEHTPKAQPND